MPIEAPQIANTDPITPIESIARFDYQTEFVSSMRGMRIHPDYQALIAMGEETIPPVLRALQKRPSWIALALDDITGQNVTGLISDGTYPIPTTASEVTENSLRWAEQESLIEIRDKAQRLAKGKEALAGLKRVFLSDPAVTHAMALASFNGGTDDPSQIRSILATLQLDQLPARISYLYQPDYSVGFRHVGSAESITIGRGPQDLVFATVRRNNIDLVDYARFGAEGSRDNTHATFDSILRLIDNPPNLHFTNVEAHIVPQGILPEIY